MKPGGCRFLSMSPFTGVPFGYLFLTHCHFFGCLWLLALTFNADIAFGRLGSAASRNSKSEPVRCHPVPAVESPFKLQMGSFHQGYVNPTNIRLRAWPGASGTFVGEHTKSSSSDEGKRIVLHPGSLPRSCFSCFFLIRSGTFWCFFVFWFVVV